LALVAGVHITTALMLYFENRQARPIRYAGGEAPYASYASRTMALTGSVLLAFVLFHLLHFTAGVVQPNIMDFEDHGRHDVYRMVIHGFSSVWVSVTYIVAMGFLYFHLSHGISSVFQSLGLKNRHYGGFILGFSQGAALLLFLGNCSIPLAVLLGWLRDLPQ
jgi:succinate dehydrogenase / fumarate reductase, cytochrome b subunit